MSNPSGTHRRQAQPRPQSVIDWKHVAMALLTLLEENAGGVFEDEWHLYSIPEEWRDAIVAEWRETEEE
jgi:hypothetical protein